MESTRNTIVENLHLGSYLPTSPGKKGRRKKGANGLPVLPLESYTPPYAVRSVTIFASLRRLTERRKFAETVTSKSGSRAGSSRCSVLPRRQGSLRDERRQWRTDILRR